MPKEHFDEKEKESLFRKRMLSSFVAWDSFSILARDWYVAEVPCVVANAKPCLHLLEPCLGTAQNKTWAVLEPHSLRAPCRCQYSMASARAVSRDGEQE